MSKDSLKPLEDEIERLKLIMTKHIAWTCCNQSLSKDEAEKLIAEINTRTNEEKGK